MAFRLLTTLTVFLAISGIYCDKLEDKLSMDAELSQVKSFFPLFHIILMPHLGCYVTAIVQYALFLILKMLQFCIFSPMH